MTTCRLGPMERQTRMFKTLGCLVGAMTTVVLLLSWMNPTTPTERSLHSEDLLSYSRALVTAETTVRPNLWNEVEIIAGTRTASSGRLLSALPDREHCHFLVDGEGRAFRMKRWANQRTSREGPHVIRIEVSQLRSGQPMTVSQSGMVRALMASLSEKTVGDGQYLPIRLDKTWSRVYHIDEETLLKITPTDRSAG